MREFDQSKYEKLRDDGKSEHEICRIAYADGHSAIICIKIIRDLFGVGLARGKEIYLQKDGDTGSLDDHLASWANVLEEAFGEVDGEHDQRDVNS